MTGKSPEFNYLISIHDVMPETFSNVSNILDRYFDLPGFAPDLLVVPGCDWETEQIDQIRKWSEKGCKLVAHGWIHKINGYGGIYHRLHSTLISRNVAEHLQLKSEGIRELMQNAFDWFSEVDLPKPEYYVPPAWALGFIKPEDLQKVPYNKVEVTRGFLNPQDRQLSKSPVLGYEADTLFRAWFLKKWNARCTRIAVRERQLLRISIHPYDFEYRLKSDLEQLLQFLKNAVL
ncbi:MAG: polysaccharide deacetylase family protein [Opitutales bacterium]|nr:polysaccharide deacetylase family protein [Opitutales bacterium]